MSSGYRRHSFKPSCTTQTMVHTLGTVQGTQEVPHFSNHRWARCFTNFLAKTCCELTFATQLKNSDSCLTTLALLPTPNVVQRKLSGQTISSSSPTGPPHPTRLSGTLRWAREILCLWTETATNRFCTPLCSLVQSRST